MESILNDLRYGARMLWKSKGLTFVALISLAVGIGANSAIFSLVDSILFRPRAFAQPEQLVELYAGERRSPYETWSYPNYLDMRARNGVLTGLAAYGLGWQFKLRGGDDIEQVWGEVVSGNYFDVLGVRAHQGRTFLPEEDSVPNRNPVVVISHGLWQRRFESDPALVGKTIILNNQSLTVVGIAPPEYTGMIRGWSTEVWIPAMILPLLDPSVGENRLTSRGSRWVTLMGRLKPDVTIEQARARFGVLREEMRAAQPAEWLRQAHGPGRELIVSILPESQTRVPPQLRGVAYGIAALLFVIVDLVLLIACMNLASMLFARAVARRSEIAVRLAIGAGRARIIRQLLTESMLLSFIAGAAGLALAVWAIDLMIAFVPALPEGVRLAFDLHLDWRVVAYTIAFSTVTGLLFGLAPALHGTRAALSAVLKDDSGAFAGQHRRSAVRRFLLIGQVAFSLLLLIAAGLVLRSLEKVRPTRLGFASENVVVAPVELDESTYDRRRGQQFYERLSDRIAGVPGVQAVSLYDGLPGGFMSRTRRSTEVEGYAAGPDEDMQIDAAIVGPRYFTNMQVPFVSGRDFDSRDRDGAPCVAIINEVFARRYLAGAASPVGRHIARYAGSMDKKEMCAIVGVIRDNDWQALQKDVRPFFAMPVLQSQRERMTLMVHTAGDPATLIPTVRQVIRELDPNMAVTDVQTLNQHFDVGLFPFRLLGIAVGVCGAMALILATIGIYGVVAYSVVQRRREMGIRIALGALQRDILKLVVGQGMLLVMYGLGAGLLLSVALTSVLTSLPLELFGISATDSLTFAAVTLLLGFVALTACFIPARRAAHVDPMVTLRNT
jgi:predicted permease